MDHRKAVLLPDALNAVAEIPPDISKHTLEKIEKTESLSTLKRKRLRSTF